MEPNYRSSYNNSFPHNNTQPNNSNVSNIYPHYMVINPTLSTNQSPTLSNSPSSAFIVVPPCSPKPTPSPNNMNNSPKINKVNAETTHIQINNSFHSPSSYSPELYNTIVPNHILCSPIHDLYTYDQSPEAYSNYQKVFFNNRERSPKYLPSERPTRKTINNNNPNNNNIDPQLWLQTVMNHNVSLAQVNNNPNYNEIKTFNNYSGLSCHQCKLKHHTIALVQCNSMLTNFSRNRPCRKKYCETCLLKYYKDISIVLSNTSSFICPSCCGNCTCAACKRRQNKKKNN